MIEVKHNSNKLDDEETLKWGRHIIQLTSEPETHPENDVLRALLAHPAAIRPLYQVLVGHDPGQGLMQMLSEIGRRVRWAHAPKKQ